MIILLHQMRDRYSCGNNLTRYINPNIAELETEIDNQLDDLAVIDPLCPKARCRNGQI